MKWFKLALAVFGLMIFIGTSCKEEEETVPEADNQVRVRDEMYYPTTIEATKFADGYELYFTASLWRGIYIFIGDTLSGTYTVFGDTLVPGEKSAVLRNQKEYPSAMPTNRGVVNLNVHSDGSISGTYSGDLAETKWQEVQIRDGKFKIAASEIKDKVKARAVTDAEGYTYKTVLIGRQVWMAEDLKTTTKLDGSKIEIVKDNKIWATIPRNTSSQFCCFYENDSNQATLYTFGAAQVVCPKGWHVSSGEDWAELLNYMVSEGYYKNEGLALKSTTSWLDDGNGMDLYGFGAKATGNRHYEYGLFGDIGKSTVFWTSSQYRSDDGTGTAVEFYSKYSLVLASQWSLSNGFSVRCVMD